MLFASLNPHLLLRRRPSCSGRLACDLQALRLPEFDRPFEISVAGVVVVALMLWLSGRLRPGCGGRTGWPEKAGGALFVIAGIGGYLQTGHLVAGLAISVLLLAVGGATADVLALGLPCRIAAVAPGAVGVTFFSALPDPLWARALAGAVCALGAGLIADVDRRTSRSSLAVLLVAASLVGAYETVPDPDFCLVLVGAMTPVLLLAWPVPLVALGGAGSAGAAGLMAWAVAVGGRGRLWTVVAGLACLGLLLAEPLAKRIAVHCSSLFEGRLGVRRATLWAAVQLGVCLLANRTSQWVPSVGLLGGLAALSVAIAAGLLALAAWRGEGRRSSP